MKNVPKLAIISFLAVSVLSGCKHAPMTSYPPAKLTGLIADTDHIIVTNKSADQDPRYRGFSFTISGDEARQIVRAISSSQRSAPTDSVFDWDLRFYRESSTFKVRISCLRARSILTAGSWNAFIRIC